MAVSTVNKPFTTARYGKLTFKILSRIDLGAVAQAAARGSRTSIGLFTAPDRCAHPPPCAQAPRSRRVAAAASRPYLRSMNGTKRDIDPASELIEEDEEQALPESEQDKIGRAHV